MTQDPLLENLKRTRSDYAHEMTWGRFLLDSYAGTGGFAGRIKPSAVSALGWVAEAYGVGAIGAGAFETYLSQYPAEESIKFKRRQEIAHYQNYVETIFDLLLSYAMKAPPTLEDLPDAVKAWTQSATVDGSTFEDLRSSVLARRSALLGWCPIVIDSQPTVAGETVTQKQASGRRAEPYIVPLTPANVLEWSRDDFGRVTWVKTRTCYTRQASPMVAATNVERYCVYTAAAVETWEVSKVDGRDVAAHLGVATHSFGEVPVICYQHKPSFEERFYGASMVGDCAVAALRLFNLDSELDEHLRSAVFPILQVPVPPGQAAPANLSVGASNALPIAGDSSQPYAYLAPPQSVADTYETRITNTIRELYRRARVSHRDGSAAESGLSKQWAFEETNRLLSDFAKTLAQADLRVLKMIARALGTGPADVEKIRVIPSKSFAVEDLLSQLQIATDALALNLGVTADRLIKRRLVGKLVENMTTEDQAAVDAELQTQGDDALQLDAADANASDIATGDAITDPVATDEQAAT